ncbi:hypothetical protein HZC20_02830 [Candidatus Peregrinibacteria bacterium]|nr:hypothetical protein [Candidatus Peregrinibacteria bacterium]
MIKTAQDIQDDIFRKMSADKKLEVWVGLWRLAKELAGDKITYGTNRSKADLDMDYLKKWAKELGVEDIIEKLRL